MRDDYFVKVIEYLQSITLVETVIVTILGFGILGIIRFIDRKYISKKSKGQTSWYSSARVLIDFLYFVIIVITVLSVLSINGINVGKYFASLGIAGIAVGFAAQDVLKDVTMGISMMVESFYKIGDVVIFNGRYGKVVSFNLKTTKLKMLDDESLLCIPNREITQIATASDWFDVDVPIGYDVDLYFARDIVKDCARRIERLKYVYSADFINTQDFADSWVVYRIRVHCLVEKRYPLRRAANAVIQNVFYERKLPFPYNVLDIENVNPEREKYGKEFANHISKHDLIEYKTVAELGKGAEKSKVIKINGTEKSYMDAINESERYASSENLSKKMRLRVRLLSEEIINLSKQLSDIESGEFFIERAGGDYQICFDAKANIDKVSKEKLLGVASDGKKTYTGFGGTILRAVDSMVSMYNTKKQGDDLSEEKIKDNIDESISQSDGDLRWSFNIYKEKENDTATKNTDSTTNDVRVDWEEVNRSVFSKLAEDVHVSVKYNQISIVVLVKGTDEK